MEFTASCFPAAHGGGWPLLCGAQALPWLGQRAGAAGTEHSQPLSADRVLLLQGSC